MNYHKILCHDLTKRHLEQFAASPSHAVVLIAPPGAGKLTLASLLAAHLLDIDDPARLVRQAYYRRISPQPASIPIEEIRGLQQFLRHKTIGRRAIRRVVLIENAHTMTVEAQNALLKLLEEPPQDTVIILTALGERSLLPTTFSRLQTIQVQPPRLADSTAYFVAQGFNHSEVIRALNISGGQPGLASTILIGEADNSVTILINEAKQLLKMPPYERLARLDALARKKDQLPDLFFALQRVLQAALSASLKNGNRNSRRLLDSLQLVYTAQENLSSNPQAKLMLTNLLLHL